MTAKAKVVGLEGVETDWSDQPVSFVGGTVTLKIELSDYTDLRGGTFRITHPGLAVDGVVVTVPDRKGTGWFGRVRPEDLSRKTSILCALTFTKETATPQPFTLVALTNCTTLANAEKTVRVFADAGALRASKVLVRTGYERNLDKRLKITRAGNRGLPATVANTVRAYTRFFGQFFFKDPDGVERKMPKGMPVTVLLGTHPTNAIEAQLDDEGRLVLEMIGYADVIAHKLLKIRFGSETGNFIVCEAPGGAPTRTLGNEPPPTGPERVFDRRFFKLPRHWNMRQSDWTVTEDGGRWKSAQGHFAMTKDGRAASVGKDTRPVKMVLDPHWQFVKFEFFDRLHGVASHASARKTVPPMVVTGDRVPPTIGQAFQDDTRSNWWLVEGGETVQCIPWVIQRGLTGTADARPNGESILRFVSAPDACIKSSSATARSYIEASATQLELGPDRLKFYDLPREWQSRNYYAALSATDGEFGWYEDIADKPTTKVKPLVFCLDDIVLTDQDLRRLKGWSQSDRLAIFNNTFDDTLGCSPEGVFDPDGTDKKAWFTKAPKAGAPEEGVNYVVRQPLWTRAIAAQGNLFDVFDRRTVASDPPDPDNDVIGARAAVRWVDTTARLGTTTTWEPIPSSPGMIRPSSDNKALPGREFKGAGLPAMTNKGSMVIQPYYGQHYTPRGNKYTDALDKSGLLGRFDMALLRACWVEDVGGNPTEIAVNLHFHRTVLNIVDAPAGGAEEFARDFVRNVLDRWNGISPVVGRATLHPQDSKKRLQVRVVDFIQMVPEAQAHTRVDVKGGADARDWRNSNGSGMTSNTGQRDGGTRFGFATAHEHGHENALPDEYNERWDGASYGQLSFKQHLPGDPFEIDGRRKEFQKPGAPMMNGNHSLHNRYFWPSAEWVRRAVAFPFVVQLGATYKAYMVPPHANADRSHSFWPLAAVNDHKLPAVAPLTANRGQVNAFLYAIGGDKFAKVTLPHLEKPEGSTEYDGVLVFTLLVRVNAWSMQDDDMKALLRALAKAARNLPGRKLSSRWYVTGTHGAGTDQAWTFKRCAVLFSPRFLVSTGPDLPTSAEWAAELGSFANPRVAVSKLAQLDAYHAVPWSSASVKAGRLATFIGPIAVPASDVRGSWDADSVIVDETTPAGFAALGQSLADYEGKGAEKWVDRYGALDALAKAAEAWVADVANAASPFLGAAQALAARARAQMPVAAAMSHIRPMEERAKALSDKRAEHEKRVVAIEAEHGKHFTVDCKREPLVSGWWDRPPMFKDLPTADDWLKSVHRNNQGDPLVLAAKAKLATYKAVKELDLAARIAALKALEGPIATPTITPPRGDWSASNTIPGKARPPGFAQIDSLLATAEAVDSTDFHARFGALLPVSQIAGAASRHPSVDPAYQAQAKALFDRAEAALPTVMTMHHVRGLEFNARIMREHLERAVASTTLTISAGALPDFEAQFLKALPSMVGIYKAGADITKADLTPLLTPLGLTGADIHAIPGA